MLELIAKRQENSKTFDLGSGKKQIQVSMGAIHYKDNYASNEAWKDIDLTFENGKITKAPYDLTVEDNKLTIKDKKSGEVSTIELLDIKGKAVSKNLNWNFVKDDKEGKARISDIDTDTDLEIVAEFSAVKFTRILKSDKAPKEAKFKVTGNFGVRALDDGGDIPVESTLKDGILTEKLTPDRPVKYPVRIDPTWQVGASLDDATEDASGVVDPTYLRWIMGDYSNRRYSGARFASVTIPNGVVITNAYLIFRAHSSDTGSFENDLYGEDTASPAQFSTDAYSITTRDRTTAVVQCDSGDLGNWTTDEDYNSPEIKTIIQELVDTYDYSSGAPLVILAIWQSGIGERDAYPFEASSSYCLQLVVTYTVVTFIPKIVGII